MRAIDTNVLVRWFTRDNERQAAIADDVMRSPVFISLTVLIETVWVLRSAPYRYSNAMVGAAVAVLLELETAHVAADRGVRWALERHTAGAHLPDMIHILSAHGAASFASFEKRLAIQAGAGSPLPIETLA